MRLTRRLLISAAILGALFWGANLVAERVAERRIAAQAQKTFGTSAPPEVSIGGFPIILNVLQGTIPNASLEGRGLIVDELRVDVFRIELEGISASLSDITGGKPIRIERGLGQAEVTSEALTAYVRRDYNVTVTVLPGKIRVSGPVRGTTATAEGTPKRVGRILRFEPDRVTVEGKPLTGPALRAAREALTFEIDLPILPGGARITSIDYRDGRAVLLAKLENATLDLSGSS